MHEAEKNSSMTNNEVLAKLYQNYAHVLFKYIFTSLSRREEAEDILIEVFLAALKYQKLFFLSEQQQFAWLIAVARNKLADWHRSAVRLPNTSLDQLLPVLRVIANERSSPEVVALKQEEYALLSQQISRLPVLQQEVLRLRFILGLRHAEIATLLGTSEGSVQTALWRAIRSLRKFYQPDPQGKKQHER